MIGLESWFHNFSQFINRANTPESLADIPRPYLEYSIWGLFKGAELTSILGKFLHSKICRFNATGSWFLRRLHSPSNLSVLSAQAVET